jgi:hypothetical protein
MNAQVEYYLNRARNGEHDTAFFGLIELPDDLLPDLERAYHDEPDPGIRSLIVEAVWQHRLPSSVDFLARALDDPNPEVWKQALDGLVTLSSPGSRSVLEMAKCRVRGRDAVRGAWIAEAIDQIDRPTFPGA